MGLTGFRDVEAGAAKVALLLLSVCASALPCASQSAPQGPDLPFQPLGLNDLISVTVYGSPEFTRTVRVSAGGTIRLPLVEHPIRAAGMLPSDLEVDIAGALRKGELMVDPIVSVTVAEYISQVTLVGALKNPGTIQAIGELRLLDAIARAGGLPEDAGAEILVRTRESGDTTKEKRILVKSLMDRQDDESNLKLHGGEEIRVPRAPRILIMGKVRKPGALVLMARLMYEDAIYSLCSTVMLTPAGRRLRSLVVTSALPGEGKTLTACHLAVANARRRRALLMDCDFRLPGVDLNCGRKVLPKILAEAKEEYDLVVIDAPPILRLSDPLELAAVADGALVLAVAGQTHRKLVFDCVEVLRQLGVCHLGLALNKASPDDPDQAYYNKYTRYYRRYLGGKPA
jgi:protein involved in polysaccharide export with SLBB domain